MRATHRRYPTDVDFELVGGGLIGRRSVEHFPNRDKVKRSSASSTETVPRLAVTQASRNNISTRSAGPASQSSRCDLTETLRNGLSGRQSDLPTALLKSSSGLLETPRTEEMHHSTSGPGSTSKLCPSKDRCRWIRRQHMATKT